jgi:diguanylate cyclase (GGDEF)-like protein
VGVTTLAVGFAGAGAGAVGGDRTTLACTAIVAALALYGLWIGRAALDPERERPAGSLDPMRLMGMGVLLIFAGELLMRVGGGGIVWIGDCGVAVGMLAVVTGVACMLRYRDGDYASDALLACIVVATTATVTVWLVGIEPQSHGLVPTGRLLLHVGSAALALLAALLCAQLGITRPGSGAARGMLVVFTVFGMAQAIEIAELIGAVRESSAPLLSTTVGIGMLGAAAADPGIAMLRWQVALAPVRLGITRLIVLVAAVLVVPAIATYRLLTGDPVAMEGVLLCSALMSLVVVVYLGALLQQWARIEHRVLHDELTGLPNRRQFHERLSLALGERMGDRSSSNAVAVMFLDLDRFKVVNDSLGHAAGNQLLHAVGLRIATSLPDGAVAARLQGDEFAVLLPSVEEGSDEALDAAQLLLERLAEPYTINRRQLYVTASIGIAHYPADGADHEGLLRSADTAMYFAKEQGRNNAQVHTGDMHATALGRFDIESALHGAIARGELKLLYQPRVDLATGKVMGAEALMRWDHPVLGPISPEQFIPIAEENGRIVALGEWALMTACKQLNAWQQSGFPELTISVNLSPRQFQLDRVADMVARVLRATEADPSWLELELTESLAMQDVDDVATTLHDLDQMGVGCSIDDFGTGYAGLSYLSRFPLRAVKIDKSFVQGLDDPATSGNQESIVLAVIAMAKGLKLQVIAEGVETNTQMYFLLRNGCDQMQGFLFSPAVTVDRFEDLVMLERIAGGAGRLGGEDPFANVVAMQRR